MAVAAAASGGGGDDEAVLLWVRHGVESAPVRFPLLHGSRRLPVSAIADHWGLEPGSLRIGDIALTSASLLSIDSLRSLLVDPGVGDGSGRDSALIVQGRLTPPPQCSACAKLIQKEQEEELRWREFRDRRIRGAVRGQRNTAIHKECVAAFSPYVLELKSGRQCTDDKFYDLVVEKVSPLVCAVHVVRGKKEEATGENYTGMAALVRPDGTCVTASKCCTRARGGKIMVVFSRLGVQYQCKVAKVDGDVSLLEPVAAITGLPACLECRNADMGRMSTLFSWRRDKKNGDLIACAGTGLEWDNEVGLFLPSICFGDLECGAPVVNTAGGICGVVVATDSDARNVKKRKYHELTSKLDVIDILPQLSPWKAKVVKQGLQHCKISRVASGRHLYSSVYDDWEKAHPFDTEEAEVAELMLDEKRVLELRKYWDAHEKRKKYP